MRRRWCIISQIDSETEEIWLTGRAMLSGVLRQGEEGEEGEDRDAAEVREKQRGGAH